MSGAPDWLDVKVARHWLEAVDVVGLELVAFDGRPLPAFEAGAYIDVLTPGDQLRPYSLCNPPAERHRYVIAVLRERRGRGASKALHDDVRAGDRLRIRAPRNEFALASRAVYSVLLCGGIGITPLLAMADALWRSGSPFELHYSARNAEHAAFADELRHRPYAGRVRFHWSEAHGHLDFAQILRRAPASCEVYACGPTKFIEGAVAAFVATARPAARLHVESFAAAPDLRHR